MRLFTNVNIGAGKSTPATQSNLDWLPSAGGVVGGVLGGILGTPADVVTGPGGTLAGGAIGAGLGGVTGKSVENIINRLQGQPQTPLGNIGSALGSGLEQSIYGAIPGGDIGGSLMGNLLKRTIGGTVGGAGAQAVRNVEQGQPITKDLLSQGLGTGAINTIIPAGSEAMNLAGSGLKKMAGSAADIAGEFAARKAAPVLENVQHFLGKQAITTQGEGKISDFAQRMMLEHNLELPPHGDPHVLLDTIKEAGNKINGQLMPYLQNFNVLDKDFAPMVKENLQKYFGTTQLKSKMAVIPPEIKNFVTQVSLLGSSPTLSQLKEVQRQAGELVQTGNWSEPKDRADQFLISTYKNFDNIIRDRLLTAQKNGEISGKEAGVYNDLMNQARFLVHARQSTEHTLGGFTKLPTSAVSESIAKGQAQMGFLGPERIKQAALRAALLAGTVGGTAFGLPKEVTAPLIALEAASILPYGGEGIANKMASGEKSLGNILQKPANSQAIMKTLQQLGVRLPGGLSGQ